MSWDFPLSLTHYATDVPLILNTQTGLVSPHFHLIYNDDFDTVKRDAKFHSLWQAKAKLQVGDHVDAPIPTFSDHMICHQTPRPVDLPLRTCSVFLGPSPLTGMGSQFQQLCQKKVAQPQCPLPILFQRQAAGTFPMSAHNGKILRPPDL